MQKNEIPRLVLKNQKYTNKANLAKYEIYYIPPSKKRKLFFDTIKKRAFELKNCFSN